MVVQTFLIEHNDQDIQIGSKWLWNPEHDDHVTVTKSFSTFSVAVNAHFISNNIIHFVHVVLILIWYTYTNLRYRSESVTSNNFSIFSQKSAIMLTRQGLLVKSDSPYSNPLLSLDTSSETLNRSDQFKILGDKFSVNRTRKIRNLVVIQKRFSSTMNRGRYRLIFELCFSINILPPIFQYWYCC